MAFWGFVHLAMLILGLFTIAVGSYIFFRCSGKMKGVIIFALIAVFSIVLKIIMSYLIGDSSIFNQVVNVSDLLIVLSLSIAALYMRRVIKEVDIRVKSKK